MLFGNYNRKCDSDKMYFSDSERFRKRDKQKRNRKRNCARDIARHEERIRLMWHGNHVHVGMKRKYHFSKLMSVYNLFELVQIGEWFYYVFGHSLCNVYLCYFSKIIIIIIIIKLKVII